MNNFQLTRYDQNAWMKEKRNNKIKKKNVRRTRRTLFRLIAHHCDDDDGLCEMGRMTQADWQKVTVHHFHSIFVRWPICCVCLRVYSTVLQYGEATSNSNYAANENKNQNEWTYHSTLGPQSEKKCVIVYIHWLAERHFLGRYKLNESEENIRNNRNDVVRERERDKMYNDDGTENIVNEHYCHHNSNNNVNLVIILVTVTGMCVDAAAAAVAPMCNAFCLLSIAISMPEEEWFSFQWCMCVLSGYFNAWLAIEPKRNRNM